MPKLSTRFYLIRLESKVLIRLKIETESKLGFRKLSHRELNTSQFMISSESFENDLVFTRRDDVLQRTTANISLTTSCLNKYFN